MEQTGTLPERKDIPAEDKWKIEDLYENDEKWEREFEQLEKLTEEFKRFRGKAGENGRTLLETLTAQDEIAKLQERVYVYASQKNHEDMGNSVYQQLFLRAQTLTSRILDSCSFVEPEILNIPDERLAAYLKEEPGWACTGGIFSKNAG